MSSFKVVTISSHAPRSWYYLYDLFFKSLGEYKPTVIDGARYGKWGGLASKPKWLYEAIKDKTIDSSYIIFVDSWDLVFTTSPIEIMERYFSFETDIVISSERNCFPADLKEEFDKIAAPTEYKYLNSGCIVGKTDAIFSCLEAMGLPNLPDDYFDFEKNCNVHPNDQFEWMKVFFKQPVSISLDYYQALSQTLHNASIDEFDFSEKRIRNIITNSRPCTIHFNGGSKDNTELRNPILKHLNLL